MGFERLGRSIITAIGGLGIVAAVTVGGVSAAGPPHAGDPAPNFSDPQVRGGTFTLAKTEGKPVYLNFFASWCTPCQQETPSIVRLSTKYAPKGLVMVGIDTLEDTSAAKPFIAKYHIRYDVVTDQGSTEREYGAFGLPMHVFIARDGKISYVRLGEMQPDEIEAQIKRIL